MSDRLDRYKAAVMLAQVILESDAELDSFLIAQAVIDIRDEVAAGRRNQAEFPAAAARVLDLIEGGHSLRVVE